MDKDRRAMTTKGKFRTLVHGMNYGSNYFEKHLPKGGIAL